MENSPVPKSNSILIAQVPTAIKEEIFARANVRGESASMIVRELLKVSLQKTA